MNYFSRIKGIKESEEGTDLVIHIPGEYIQQEILSKRSYNAEIRIDDGRLISAEQRKKIFATIRDIALYTGDDAEYLRSILTYDYCSKSGENYFSLSNCSMTTAREFITHIIDFALEWFIPLSDLAINRVEDIDRYLYSCIKYKRCSICGRTPSDLHHYDTLGMGIDRTTYDDSQHKKIQLCRHHHQEAHQIGRDTFSEKYKVYGILYKEG